MFYHLRLRQSVCLNRSMYAFILLLVVALVLGGVVDVCADQHADHADTDCVGVCCQPVSPHSFTTSLLKAPSVYDLLPYFTDDVSDNPLVGTLFRPPEAA